MTVPSVTGVARYPGNGATSTFSVPFYFQADADVEVIVYNTSTDVDTTLTLNTNYALTGRGDTDGGSATLTGAYANLSSSYIIYVGLAPALNNSTSFLGSGRVSNAQLQVAFDRMSQRLIYLKTLIDRCFKVPLNETPTAAKTTFPDSTDRASRSLTFDSSGNPSATTEVDPGSLSVTAIGETIVEAANAGAVLDALGFTAATKALIDETSNANFMTQLGITAAGQSILDDASVSAIRSTLGIDGSSGNIDVNDLANSAIAQLFQARLTMTSATPVTTSDVTAGTIYLTPFRGNKIALYNGTRWKLHTLTEISLALTATSGSVYDVWVYDNSGTLTLETTVWTNTTTRATALATQDGVYCKTGALTRRYVGTFYAIGTDQTADSSSTGRYLWNYYNRVPKWMAKANADPSWTYTTATMRQADGDTLNQLNFVVGVVEDAIRAQLIALSANSSANIIRMAAIGYDSTISGGGSGWSHFCNAIGTGTAINEVAVHNATIVGFPGIGRHFLSWNEYSAASGTTTWAGTDVTVTPERAGISGTFYC